MKRSLLLLVSIAGLVWFLSAVRGTSAQTVQYSPETQSPALFYNEARTVYLGNLQRRANGLPPLRWNREMTIAARWFSWDSVENRPNGYCGHTDTLGRAPWDRTAIFGYPGWGGAENAFCGYVTPEDAINGWMNSSGHRANLLSPDWREIGLGYYRRDSDSRGYVTQDFGNDGVYPPLVIENEAPSTTTQQVKLYIYDSQGKGGVTDIGPAVQMEVSNNACFAGSNWQAYQAEPDWTLAAGEGWKTVYSRIKDRLGRTINASDTIYLGASVPTSEISFAQTSQNSSTITLYNLNGGGMPKAQFSLGWIGDDNNESFTKWWGNGERVQDTSATGGTAYRMYNGDGETMSWISLYGFLSGKNNFVAYFRLKTNDNSSSSQIARIKVASNGNDDTAQEMVINGQDFKAANQYQEFAYPFSFDDSASKKWLTFYIWRSGSADIYFDSATVFTASQPLNGSTYTWNVPGNHARGQGVWVRYANDSGAFTGIQEAETAQSYSVSPQQINRMVKTGHTTQHTQVLVNTCGNTAWSVGSKPGWLRFTQTGNTLDVWGDAGGLSPNTYQGNLVLQFGSTGSTVTLPASLTVVDEIYNVSLPLLQR